MQDEVEVATRWLSRADLETKSVSYAQNCEDILLDRVFGRTHAGLYVDVGANDPVFHSVTKLLYERGWRGVNIEPTPSLHRRLVEGRPGDVNLHCGISDAEGTLTFYEVAPPLHGWSTFLPEMAASYRDIHHVFPTERPIPVTTLNRVFEDHVGDRTVDVLKVDAEGFERHVLAGLDWARWRPRVVLVEATWAAAWEHHILGSNYTKAAFDGINFYYVRGEDPQLLPSFAAPVNLLDNYIPHEYVRLLEYEVAHAFAVGRGNPSVIRVYEPPPRSDADLLGPTALHLALRLRDAAHKNPGMAKLVKRILKLVG